MQIIRCTQKLLKELSMEMEDDVVVLPSASWHANLLRYDRRKCLLFTHDTTLFSVFVPGVVKKDFSDLPDIFGQALFKTMLRLNFSQQEIESILERVRDIRFGRTNNRSVLGSMNDIKQMIDLFVYDSGGLKHTNLYEMIRQINEMPFKAIGYRFPIEAMHRLCKRVES